MQSTSGLNLFSSSEGGKIMNPLFEYFQYNHALAKIEYAIMTKASCLTLEDFDLEILPESVLKCDHICELLLAHNKLHTLTIHLHCLKNLHTLAVDYNNLDTFPDALKELTQLKFLNISHNPIKDLTENIGCLTNLEHLWCNACCLTAIPNAIGNLEQLDTFGARNNLISQISPGVCKLVNMRWLTLDNNKLTSVPAAFENLQNLIHLNLARNHFNSIPYTLSKLKKLRYLLFQNNELFSLNESVLQKMRLVSKINLMNNPISSNKEVLNKFNNILLPGVNYEAPATEVESDTDSETTSTDWEDSIGSSEIDFGRSEEASDDEDAPVDVLPKLSKYLLTY